MIDQKQSSKLFLTNLHGVQWNLLFAFNSSSSKEHWAPAPTGIGGLLLIFLSAWSKALTGTNPRLHVFVCGGNPAPGSNSERHMEGMQTLHRKTLPTQQLTPGSSCCEVTVLTITPPCDATLGCRLPLKLIEEAFYWNTFLFFPSLSNLRHQSPSLIPVTLHGPSSILHFGPFWKSFTLVYIELVEIKVIIETESYIS